MIVTRLAWTVTCATTLASCGWLAGLRSYGLGGGDGGDAGDGPPPGSPPKPTAMFPWNGYDTGAVTATTAVMPTFTWPAVDGATAYEIELSQSCTVATMQTCSLGSPMMVEAGTSYTPSTALDVQMSGPAGRRWFWRIAACNGAGCNWSDVRYLNVGRLANDFDGDGLSDLAIGTAADELWRFSDIALMGTSSGQMYNGYGSGFGLAVSTGDFNGDGFGDLAIYADGSDQAGLMVALLGGGNVSATVVATGPMSGSRLGLMSLCPGDLEGDGYDDLVVIADRSVIEFPGGPGGLGSAGTPVMGSTGILFAYGMSGVGDVDGDGFPDFAVASAGGPVTLFYGPLSSGRTALLGMPGDEALWGAAITGGDIDGDGFSDVIISGNANSTGVGVIYAFHGGPSGISMTPMRLFANATAGMSFGRALLYRREGTTYALGIGDRGQAWVSYDGESLNELTYPLALTTTYGAELGGGDFEGSGYEALVVGSIGDQPETVEIACGAAYEFGIQAGGASSARPLDAPDCMAQEEFGVAIGH